MKLNFTKMQGAGNDYIYIDCRAAGLPPDAAAWGGAAVAAAFFGGCGRGDLPLSPAAGRRRRGHADVQRRRQRGGHVRQRCALRGGIFIHPRRAAGLYPYRHALCRAAGAAPGRGRAVAGRDGPLYGSTGRRGGRGAGRWTAAWMCRSAQAGARGGCTV